jgi:hypothetical protein
MQILQYEKRNLIFELMLLYEKRNVLRLFYRCSEHDSCRTPQRMEPSCVIKLPCWVKRYKKRPSVSILIA